MNLGYDWPVTQFPSLLQHSSCLDLHFPQLILNSHIWQLWMFRKVQYGVHTDDFQKGLKMLSFEEKNIVYC